MSSFALYTYGNELLNQIFIVVHLGILLTLALLNDILLDKFVLIILFLNAASLVITLAYHSAFGVSILFVNLLIACFTFNNIQVDKNTYLWIHLIPALAWTIIVVFSVKGEYWQANGDLYEYSFLECEYQKNTIGIMSLGCIYHFFAIIETFKCRRVTKCFVTMPLIICYLFSIIEADCRSATFAAILFGILYYLIDSEISYKVYYIIIVAGIICSGLFTIYYVNNILEADIGNVMGRNTFNRLGTWNAAFSLIKRYPIFGSGTDIKMLTYDSAHNSVLSILKTIGCIPLVTYVLCFAKRLTTRKYLSYSRICQISIISSLIVSVFESFFVESYIYLA